MKLALVTGGLHRLGGVIARRFASEGYALALHGHAATEPDPGLLDTIQRHGVRWQAFHADFRNEAEVEGLIPAIVDRFGAPPTVVVDNAALFSDDDWRTITPEALLRHLQVNVAAGAVLACRLAASLREGDRAVVIKIVDQRIANPHGDQLSYTLSKQAAAEAIRTLARALAPRVRVCGIAPGLTLPTPEYGERQLARLANLMPLGRLPTPDEIANAAIFLAGAQSTTGQIVFVDGGAGLESYDRDFVRMGLPPEGEEG